jgi:hypothetical protein
MHCDESPRGSNWVMVTVMTAYVIFQTYVLIGAIIGGSMKAHTAAAASVVNVAVWWIVFCIRRLLFTQGGVVCDLFAFGVGTAVAYIAKWAIEAW